MLYVDNVCYNKTLLSYTGHKKAHETVAVLMKASLERDMMTLFWLFAF